jgi:ABC-type sugar transport system ATPase subunit
MNFLSATLRDGKLRAGPFEFRPRASDRGLRRRRLEVGIRPEHIEVVPDGRSGVDAQIHLVDVAGSETFVHLAAGKQELVARVRHGVRPKVGATVRLKVRRANTHLFDAHSGVALQAG